MTSLDALAPTQTMFHAAATAAAAKPLPAGGGSDRFPFRKYIIVADHGREYAFAFSGDLTHCDACPLSAGRVISAGSFFILNGKVVLTGVGSSTLNLISRPQDAALIQSLFSESV